MASALPPFSGDFRYPHGIERVLPAPRQPQPSSRRPRAPPRRPPRCRCRLPSPPGHAFPATCHANCLRCLSKGVFAIAASRHRPWGMLHEHRRQRQSVFPRLFDSLDEPNRLAIETADGQRISYGDLIARTGRVANVLVARGVKPGDRVAAQIEKNRSKNLVLLSGGRPRPARSICRSTPPTR